MLRYSQVVGIIRMCEGFLLGDSESHTLSQSAVIDPLLYLWDQNLVRNRARHWATTSIKSIIPSSVQLWKVHRGTLKIALHHTFQDMPLRVVACASSGSGKSLLCATSWRERSYARTGYIVSDIGPDLPCRPAPSDIP